MTHRTDQQVLDRIVRAGRSRGISRRSFMGHATAAGLTATGASALWTGQVSAMTPRRGGTFRVAIHDANTTDTHDPGQYLSVFMIQLAHASRSYLTMIMPDSTVGPDMADGWSASPDAKTWTFDLNKDATFHDGRKFTSRDAAASIKHHLGEDSTSAAKSLLGNVVDVRTDGDHTLIIEMDQGLADLPYILTDYHIAMAPADGDGNLDWKGGIGAGPYRLDSWEPGVGANFSRHDGWHGEGAYFDAIEMLAINDPNARQTALVSGDVDAVSSVELKTLSFLERRDDIQILNLPSASAVTVPMHVTAAPFDNLDVRMAMKYAMNREELIEKIVFGTATLGNDFHISPSMPYYPGDIPQRGYDPDKAKHHLKKAGMEGLTMDISAADSIMPGAVDFVTLYAEQAKAAGITLKPIREPNDGYWSDVWLKKPFIFSKWGARPTPDMIFTLAYQTNAAWSEAFWSNEEFDKLLLQGKAELDDTLRAEIYRDMAMIARDDGGTILPMFTNYVYAHNKSVAHPEQLASSWELDGARGSHRWWFTS